MEIETRPQPEVKQAIDDSVLTLEHASTCRETKCSVRPNCTTIKRIIEHSKICRRVGKTNCLACRALVSLSYDHTKGCLDIRCVVPFCDIIKVQMLKFRLYRVQSRLATAQPRAVYELIDRPTENQPQLLRAAPKDFEEIELPPLKASPELNQPPGHVSPEQIYQPRQDASLFFLVPEQEAWARRTFYWRPVCYDRRTRAAAAPTEPAPQEPKPDEGVGCLLNTGLGPLPPRTRVKKSTYQWVSNMLFTN